MHNLLSSPRVAAEETMKTSIKIKRGGGNVFED
jgi:hypothetical protein